MTVHRLENAAMDEAMPYAVQCRVRVGSSRTGWVVAASAHPPWIVAVKMDDTGLTEAHAAENVSDERDPIGSE